MTFLFFNFKILTLVRSPFLAKAKTQYSTHPKRRKKKKKKRKEKLKNGGKNCNWVQSWFFFFVQASKFVFVGVLGCGSIWLNYLLKLKLKSTRIQIKFRLTCLVRRTSVRKRELPALPAETGRTVSAVDTEIVQMRAVVFEKPGLPNVLKLVELDNPEVGDDEVLISIAATAVNRIDLEQRFFGIKSGGLCCLGLECSGVVKAVGPSVTEWKVGDKVCAVLDGGGYAEEVVVSAKLVLPVPSNVPLTYAASLPEAACNAWEVISRADLGPRKRLLIHECSGDIGLFVLQMAKCKGTLVFVTAETDEKLDFYKRYGADICINYKKEDFVARVKEETYDGGVHVVVDSWGVNLEKDLQILSHRGKLLFVDVHGSQLGQVNFGTLMSSQVKIQVIYRWSTSLDRRASIVDSLKREVWPTIENGLVQPVVYKTLQLSEAAAAHSLMESADIYQNILSVIGLLTPWLKRYSRTAKVAGHVMGKILLTPDRESPESQSSRACHGKDFQEMSLMSFGEQNFGNLWN